MLYILLTSLHLFLLCPLSRVDPYGGSPTSSYNRSSAMYRVET